MRISRKSGLLPCAVKWIKYACKLVEEPQYDYTETDWHMFRIADAADTSIRGYHNYGKAWFGDTCYYYLEYPITTISADYYGTVYELENSVGGHSDTVIQHTIEASNEVSSGVVLKSYERTITRHLTGYVDGYEVEDEIGTVRAGKNEYPDEKNGYSYVTTTGGYTIMKGYDNYYAYKKEAST